MKGKITYRQQYTRCGKQRCRKCKEGEGHGPYWYAYWSEKGRTVSKYIGAQLPENAHPSIEGEAKDARYSSDTPQTTARPSLRIYLLGQFRIERLHGNAWSTIDSRTWHRRRARALLGCLLSNPGRRLGREQVMELLWPGLDIDVAANRLNGAVHELRQILEPEITRPAASRLLRLERDILELADSSELWVDAEEFERLLKEANSTNDSSSREHLLEEANKLYKGSYLLEELYSEWAAPRRDALQRAWIGLLLDLANLRIEQGAYTGAIETLDRLRTAEPTNETALQRLMILLTQLDRRGEAIQMYRQHVSMLQRDYECEPLPETTQLYEALLRGHLPPLPLAPSTLQHALPAREKHGELSAPAPDQSEAAVHEISFTRPLFQIGRHNQSPLIGRHGEMATMRQVMLSIEALGGQKDYPEPAAPRIPTITTSSARAKQPHFLLLRGEAGIGKTRLAEELSIEAYERGWTVAWSRSYEQEGTIPYRPWTELLRTLLRGISLSQRQPDTHTTMAGAPWQPLSQVKLERLGALLPELAHQGPASAPLSYEQERFHLWEATLGLLEKLGNMYPLLLVLDDLHWADDSSIDLLAYLAHHLQHQPILLLATCRDVELPSQHKLRMLNDDLCREQASVTISVEPLTHWQIGTLLSHLPQEVVQAIQNQAAGNPFFAEELARSIKGTERDEDLYASDVTSLQRATRPQRSLPEAIAAVLERRLSRLSNDCQALLSKAAVYGGSFELGQLLPMAGEHNEDTILDLLDEALQAGLLIEEGAGAHITYHFWHPLIISHLYERLSAARRAQLHRKAAEALQAAHASTPEEAAPDIVFHLNKGAGDPAQLAYYAELAGNQAYKLAAYAEVQRYYLQAIQAMIGQPATVDETIDTQLHIQALTSRLLKSNTIPQPLHICRLLEHIAECSMQLGNSQQARQVYECVLQLRTTDSFFQQAYPAEMAREERKRQEVQLQALLWREIGNTWAATGDYPHAYECYRRGKEVMRTAGITTGAAWACLHLQHGALLRVQGNYIEAHRYLQEALAMLEASVRLERAELISSTRNSSLPAPAGPQAFSQPPAHHILFQQNKGLQTRTERALLGDPLEIGYAHERLGIVAASVGHLGEAFDHLHTALKIFEQGEHISEMARVCGNLAATYATKGSHGTAQQYMHRSLHLLERTGNLPYQAFIMGNLGDIIHRTGNLLEAERWLKRGLELAERIHDRERMSWFNVELAAVQQDLGNLPEAATSLRRAICIGRAIHSRRCIRYALIGLGNLRLTEAIINHQLLVPSRPEDEQQAKACQRQLLRAKSTIERAVSLEEVELEAIIDGKHLLATLYLLLQELEQAEQMALHLLQEARDNELIRMVGCIERLLGRILSQQGRYEEADPHFEEAIKLCRAHELELDYARALQGYGVSLLQRSMAIDAHSATYHADEQEMRESTYQRGLSYLHEAQSLFFACHAATDLIWLEQFLVAFSPAAATGKQ